jgi:hypothetical protein
VAFSGREPPSHFWQRGAAYSPHLPDRLDALAIKHGLHLADVVHLANRIMRLAAALLVAKAYIVPSSDSMDDSRLPHRTLPRSTCLISFA